IYSKRLIETHFWIATIGVVLYITSMWISGIMQGLMWRAFNSDGTLTYSFVESVQAMHPFYIVRFLGGALFLTGMLIMAYNIYRTVSSGKAVTTVVSAPAAAH
ncbi:MAG: cbb3-type cytochrome c oxidase subunit I, partial [Gammaproteobacteria bacterium]